MCQTQPQENAFCVRANSVVNIVTFQYFGKPLLSPERQAKSPQAVSFQRQHDFKTATGLTLIGSHHSVLIKEVVTRNAERESFSVFIAFNLLSSNPVTLQREAETTVQSEAAHTPWSKRLPLESEVQKEVTDSYCPTKCRVLLGFFIMSWSPASRASRGRNETRCTGLHGVPRQTSVKTGDSSPSRHLRTRTERPNTTLNLLQVPEQVQRPRRVPSLHPRGWSGGLVRNTPQNKKGRGKPTPRGRGLRSGPKLSGGWLPARAKRRNPGLRDGPRPYRTPGPSSAAGTPTPAGSGPACPRPRPRWRAPPRPAPPGAAASRTPVPGTSPARTAPPRLLRTPARAPWCPGAARRGGGAGGRLRALPALREAASGRRRGRGSPPPPPPGVRAPGAAAHLQPAGGTQAGRRVQRGPGRGRVRAQVWVPPGRGRGRAREGRLAGQSSRSRLPKPRPACPAAAAGSGWGWSGAGRAGQGAPPPGAAPSDRLRPPPRGLRASAPSAWGRGALAPGSPPPALSPHPRNEPARPPPNSQATAAVAAPAPAPAAPQISAARQPRRWRRRQAASQGDRPEQSRAERRAACAIE